MGQQKWILLRSGMDKEDLVSLIVSPQYDPNENSHRFKLFKFENKEILETNNI